MSDDTATFDADMCEAFCHPEESVTVSADDWAEILCELWAMGYCWPLIDTPKNDDQWPELPEVMRVEAKGVRDGYGRIVDAINRLTNEMDDGWFWRALKRKQQRETWAEADAAKAEGGPR